MKSNYLIKKRLLLLCTSVLLLLYLCPVSEAQNSNDSVSLYTNIIPTAVPFLRIAPDARSSSMGDAGVATSPDANLIFWNTARLPFAVKSTGISANYIPWMKSLTNDMSMSSIGSYFKIHGTQGLALGLRYFSYGKIDFTNSSGGFVSEYNPREYCFDAGYGIKLTDNFSMGLNLGFVYSSLANGFLTTTNVPIQSGKAIKADLSFFYNHPLTISKTRGSSFNVGAAISNIGNKISYTASAADKDFLPTNLAIGSSIILQCDKFNRISLNLDLNKLLVPTPDPNENYKRESVVEGMLKSFSDAPGGFSEELREVMISTGFEYSYKNLFFMRGGFFHEDKTKGGQQYITAGFGIKYNVVGLDLSYLIPTSGSVSPLDNTIKFTLTFDFDKSNKNNNIQPGTDD